MERATTMEPEAAAAVLEQALSSGLKKTGELTIADAAAKAGLALRDAERGLHFLSSKYRGTLAVTEQGELLFRFPHGFSLPLLKKPWLLRFVDRSRRAVLGAAKFVVRAWISVVLIGYAAVFLALALALAFSGNRDDDRAFAPAYLVLRVIAEALFWTFHPFSPFAYQDARGEAPRRRREQTTPFYEKVNRFVFGPDDKKPDAREMERRILQQIRVNAGRIGIADVLQVTGLPRAEADPLMSRLLLDYEGDIDVSEDGAITYRFEKLRKTANTLATQAPPPVWRDKVLPPPITGNEAGSNLLIAGLNGFNLIMAWVALQMNLTVDRVIHFFTTIQDQIPAPPLPYDGIPWALGAVPFVFSALLFALPMWRWATDASRKKKAAEENARRAVLKTVIEEVKKDGVGVREDTLKRAWQQATGEAPNDKQLIEQVVELGGDVDMDAHAEGRGLFRFRDLEAEVEELKRQRAATSVQETQVGQVVFRAE